MTPAYEGMGLDSFAINATADYSGSDTHGTFQFRGFQLDPSNPGNAILPAGAGQAIFGVLVNAPRLNEACQLRFFGECKVQIGASVSGANISLMVDANGNFVPATTGNLIVAISRFGSGSAYDYITALILGPTGIVNPHA